MEGLMDKGEDEKPQYTLQPTVYFHAKDNDEARQRAQIIRAAIERGLADTDETSAARFTYTEVEIRPGSLVLDRHHSIGIGEAIN